MKLDVVIIATVRPEILRMTLATFTARLLNQFQTRAFINVDPVGDTDLYMPMDLVDMCRGYFDQVIYRIPSAPNFAAAVQWGWRQAQTPLCFHLEDDWILRRTLDAATILPAFDDPAVVGVNVSGLEAAPAGFIKSDAISLNPCFFRAAYIKQLAERMDTTKDPEHQFGAKEKQPTDDFPGPVFLRYFTRKPLIIDSGMWWRRARNMRKARMHLADGFWRAHENPFWKRLTVDALRTCWRKIRWAFVRRYYHWRYVRACGVWRD